MARERPRSPRACGSSASDWLTFDNLSLGPEAGLQGGNDGGRRADHIRVQRCTISLTAGNPAPGINATGDDWTIAGNTVANIGNSGMLLTGDSYTILGNTIDRTGPGRGDWTTASTGST